MLSPAHSGGRRASILVSERAEFDLARQLRGPLGAPLGEVFSFLSGLYFRGKLAYARAFARPLLGAVGAYVITTNRGLLPIETPIRREDLRTFAQNGIDLGDDRYRVPLEQTARDLRCAAVGCEIVLLGSIATGKYIDVLLEVFGSRLHFPSEFVGRGDMSRGGLMLRCVESRQELSYVPVSGAIRRGKRPPKLQPRTVIRHFGLGCVSKPNRPATSRFSPSIQEPSPKRLSLIESLNASDDE